MAGEAPATRAVTTPIRWRRSARRLTPGQAALLRDGFTAMMGIGDDRGYGYFAGIHGLPRPIGCDNAHGTPYFLPWHRAYLYFFERALRDQVPDAMLTWWDWTVNDIPALFADKKDAQGNPNRLLTAPVDPLALRQGRQARPPIRVSPRTSRQPGLPGTPPLPDRAEVQAALREPDFLSFTQNVEDLHNRVHVWVGGQTGHMSQIAFAAFDPIFWAHHAMIDRLWRLWQLRHPGADPPAALLRDALPPFAMTVAQTLDTTSLGYDYAASTSSASTV